MRGRALAGPLAVLAGAAAVGGCAPRRAMLVQASGTGEAGAPCTIEVDGRRIPAGDFLAFARRWRGREAHLRGSGYVAYRCVGGIIFELQRAGFRRIGFISEPALEADR